MLRILQRRNASLHVLLYPARVQGAGAGDEIAAGIRYFNRRSDIDVIIVGRGGGSIEDLWAFNEEVVARAIYNSAVPLISAVGHEVDYTIADFVADLRAPTPSAAAEMVSGAREDLRATVNSLHSRMMQAMRLGLERRRYAVEHLARNRAFNIAPNRIRDLQQRFDETALRLGQAAREYLSGLRHRCHLWHTRLVRLDLRQTVSRRVERLARERQALGTAMRNTLHRKGAGLQLAAGRLDALSPLAILHRGYSICRDESGRILKSASGVVPEQKVHVCLARGELYCRVDRIDIHVEPERELREDL
jgi:exodeoxyribonuclease VII large subunit